MKPPRLPALIGINYHVEMKVTVCLGVSDELFESVSTVSSGARNVRPFLCYSTR